MITVPLRTRSTTRNSVISKDKINMAKLKILSFEDDYIIAQRIKEESNYCDVAHLYVATYGICQVVLQELSPIDLDGNGRLTIFANVEKQKVTPGYKNRKAGAV